MSTQPEQAVKECQSVPPQSNTDIEMELPKRSLKRAVEENIIEQKEKEAVPAKLLKSEPPYSKKVSKEESEDPGGSVVKEIHGGAGGSKGAVATGSKDAVVSGSKDAVTSGSKDGVAIGSKDAVASGSKDAVSTGSKDAIASGSKDAVEISGSKDAVASGSKDAVSTGSKDGVSSGSKDAVAGDSKDVDPSGSTDVIASGSKDGGEGTSKDGFTKPGQPKKRDRRKKDIVRLAKAKLGRNKFVRKQRVVNGRVILFKRRKKEHGVIVPPTKFLLGGNINDPLNLNSLQDEEINRAMNAVTPKSSPLPTPKHRTGEVEVLLPRNLKDPLLLTSDANDQEYVKMLSKKKRKRKRKRGNSGSGSGKEESFEADPAVPVEEPNATIEGAFVPPDNVPAKRENLALNVKDAPKRRKPEGLDKIVSPVVPQPGAWKRGQPRAGPGPPKRRKPAATPKFNPRNTQYQYGNYDRYYGYRNPNREADHRLQCFMQMPHLFLDKDVLDIGCNIGHVTLCVARDMGARSIVGLDIDKKLIGIARKNVKHYVTVAETPKYSNCPSSRMATPRTPHPQMQDSPANQSPFPQQQQQQHYMPNSPATHQSPYGFQYSPAPASQSPFAHHYVPNSPAYQQSPCPHQQSPAASRSPFPTAPSPGNVSPQPLSPLIEPQQQESLSPVPPHPNFFPISMPILYGPLDLPGFCTPDGPSLGVKAFPHNVSFVQGSYVLESEALLATETAQFDVILCLSVTKWIHLNWGDAGIKRAFRRMFAQLRPGGKLILEPQGWPSYNKKKALTEQIYRNYLSIQLPPSKFIEYLLSPNVGFSSVEDIAVPAHPSKGFRRPLHILTKPGQTPSSCNTPVCYTPYAQRTCVRKPVYTSLGSANFDTEDDKKK